MITWAMRLGPSSRLVAVAVLSAGLAWRVGIFLSTSSMETIRASVVLSLLVVVSLYVFWVFTRREPDGSFIFALLLVSLAMKLLAVYFRFVGRLLADAFGYDVWGELIVTAWLTKGDWPGFATGTEFVRLLTGLVYFVTGTTFYGASILWAWLGLLGMFFFYKAFACAFPRGDRRLYAYLILLYPSMLLWTSSLGKDALMVLSLGMAAYGAAGLLRRIGFIGLWWLALGIGGMLMIRGHLAAVFAVAVAAAALIRPIRAGMLGPVIRFIGAVVVAIVCLAVVRMAAEFIRLESLAPTDVVSFMQKHQATSTRGGSARESIDPKSVPGFAVAIPTVLFRPFPWESHSMFALIAAFEGLGLLALMAYRWRSLVTAISQTARNPYLLLILVYVLLFIFFFSAMSNFGIIARQRVQLFPFVFMWIAYLKDQMDQPSS